MTQSCRGTRLIRFLPAVAAGMYPFLVQAFHHFAGPPAAHATMPQRAGAAMFLITMLIVPALGIVCAAIPGQGVGARRLAYASVAAPTLYVFLGVVQTLAGSPLPDALVWCLIWLSAAAYMETTRGRLQGTRRKPDLARWRVAHGVTGAIILFYALFHIANHVFGLIGPEAYAAVMDLGRKVYRAPYIEPALVLALFFQVGSGLYVAWHESIVVPADFQRLIQVASGFYLSVFLLGHMNSVFIYARTVLGIPTDWAFATGAPTGLIHDAWNIRLLPHYALGVFFMLAHLVSGFRIVVIAHGVSQPIANRLWTTGVSVSALVATAIIAGMCGVRP
ncbi:hypothetical protein [Nguyenibacter vanlangensis]|uniref:Uncharacterized protein n=1 Tax=Nguyenibacter vanlangensis TaxID=1216886 RepID=A0A7Y7IV06_9PROT|nr:hypothetical protein [Nguyenibacter vanlangensis]NVN10851.1 hypothetical protein [Nguyenibacter vanlangensis]